MVLEDRSGSDDPATLTKNVFGFLGALKNRPEIAAAIPSYEPAVPQIYADVDQEKVIQQQVQLSDVYSTMSTFMGGYLVNYFNRFGRQWQTYVEAEGTSRTDINNISQFYVRSANGGQVPARLARPRQADHRPRVHLSLQRVPCRPDQRHRRPRLQLRPDPRRARTSPFSKPCPPAPASTTPA